MPMELKNISKEQIQRQRAIEQFKKFDWDKITELFSLEHDEENMYIVFLQKKYTIIKKTGEIYQDGRLADLNEIASILELLTKSEHVPHPTGEWASIAALCANTTDTSLTRYIEYLKPFQDDIALMQRSLKKLGGTASSKGDVSAIIQVFENVPVWFQYWAADDEFPPSVQFLFDSGILDHFRWSILWDVMTVITNRMKEEAGI